MVTLSGQNVFDIAVQEFGQIDNIIRDVLIPNGLTFDSELKTGMTLGTDNYKKGNYEVKEFFKNNKAKPVNKQI